MPDIESLESLLVADIGSVNTKVGLVDRVAGEHRFVGVGASATTAGSPHADVMIGVRQAIRQVEAHTQRRLLTEDGQLIVPERPNGQGVDGFAAVASAPAPLQVAVVGLSREVSVASAIAAARGTCSSIVATLALDQAGGRWHGTLASGTNGGGASIKAGAATGDADKPVAPAADPVVIAAEALARANPEVILLVGGVDGGATAALGELANLIAAIIAARESTDRPVVIFAGNREARSQIATRIGQLAPLRVVDNVHPTLDRENAAPLKRELETLYAERRLARLPGLGGLSNWTKQPILPAATTFERVVRFLSRRYDLDVMGVDVGAAHMVLVRARSSLKSIRSDLGIGSVLEQMPAQAKKDAYEWLPIETGEDEFRAFYANQILRPGSIPATRAEARMHQALARQALTIAAAGCDLQRVAVDLILLTGGLFTFNSDYGALALMALDALQTEGVFTLAVDLTGMAPAFGALAGLNPQAAASVVERDGFLRLGTVIAPTSGNHDGQIDLRVRVQAAGSGEIKLDVEHGSIELVPLPLGQKATLTVEPAKGVHLRGARRGTFEGEVEGGALGLVIDARGRPLLLPPGPDKRREKIQQWYWDVGS